MNSFVFDPHKPPDVVQTFKFSQRISVWPELSWAGRDFQIWAQPDVEERTAANQISDNGT